MLAIKILRESKSFDIRLSRHISEYPPQTGEYSSPRGSADRSCGRVKKGREQRAGKRRAQYQDCLTKFPAAKLNDQEDASAVSRGKLRITRFSIKYKPSSVRREMPRCRVGRGDEKSVVRFSAHGSRVLSAGNTYTDLMSDMITVIRQSTAAYGAVPTEV